MSDSGSWWPYPNYTIVPAAGSLIGDVPSLRGKSPEHVDAVVARMIAQSGRRRGAN